MERRWSAGGARAAAGQSRRRSKDSAARAAAGQRRETRARAALSRTRTGRTIVWNNKIISN